MSLFYSIKISHIITVLYTMIKELSKVFLLMPTTVCLPLSIIKLHQYIIINHNQPHNTTNYPSTKSGNKCLISKLQKLITVFTVPNEN